MSQPDAATTREESENAIVVTATSTAIKSLADLVEAADVDLEVWECVSFAPNTWTTSAKTQDDQWIQIQNYQAKARFVRREPVPVFPVVAPVRAVTTYRKPEQAQGEDWQRALVLGDLHFGFRLEMAPFRLVPFHDRAALDAVLQLADVAGVDRVDVAGDILDLPDMSDKFVRSPDFARCVRPAVLEAHWWLAQFRRALPEAPILAYEGNHDERMRRAITRHVPAAYDLREEDLGIPAWSVPELLGLDRLGVEWLGGYPDARHWLNHRLAVEHGDVARKSSGASARAYLEGRDYSTVFFHIHRRERASEVRHRRGERRVIEALCPGGMCRVDAQVPGDREVNRWSQGVALADYHPDGRYTISVVPIEAGRVAWSGWEIEARDRVPDIARDLPEWEAVL